MCSCVEWPKTDVGVRWWYGVDKRRNGHEPYGLNFGEMARPILSCMMSLFVVLALFDKNYYTRWICIRISVRWGKYVFKKRFFVLIWFFQFRITVLSSFPLFQTFVLGILIFNAFLFALALFVLSLLDFFLNGVIWKLLKDFPRLLQ